MWNEECIVDLRHIRLEAMSLRGGFAYIVDTLKRFLILVHSLSYGLFCSSLSNFISPFNSKSKDCREDHDRFRRIMSASIHPRKDSRNA